MRSVLARPFLALALIALAACGDDGGSSDDAGTGDAMMAVDATTIPMDAADIDGAIDGGSLMDGQMPMDGGLDPDGGFDPDGGGSDLCPDDPDKTEPGICGCGTADDDTDSDGTADCDDGCPDDASKTTPGMCGCGNADTDTDGDGTADCDDECPDDIGKTAPGVCGCAEADVDTDGDGTLDCDDECPGDMDKTAPGTCGCGTPDADSDGNGTLDCEETCPDDPDKEIAGVCGCGVPDVDTDGDGTLDCNDGCPSDADKATPGACGCGVSDADSDSDGTLDCNENCPFDASKTEPGICGCGTPDTDTDSDGTADCDDGCAMDPEKTAPGICGCGASDVDTDGDGTADCDDGCPADASKTAPGTCGCGTSDVDTDGDGTADCDDGCPSDAAKTAPGTCGCGMSDVDTDSDGTPDCNDGCDSDASKTAPGICGCGVSDVDTDGDGTADCDDGCDGDASKTAPGICGCGTPDTDTDGDGTADCDDGCPSDAAKTAPGTCGCGMSDVDTDGDGTADCDDGCPSDMSKTAPGTCGCGTPDTDTDGDGTPDCDDNCPSVSNPGQEDADGDDIGDACECTDIDGDGYGTGETAACPNPGTVDCDDGDPAHWSDCGACTDGDGDDHGAGCDLGTDCDDGDGAAWVSCGSCSASDPDGDGYRAGCDIADCDETNPTIHEAADDIPGDGVDNDCSGGDRGVTDADFIFVADMCVGGPTPSDSNPGTQAAPVQTMTRAFELARAEGKQIVAAGEPFFDFPATYDVSLFGGYACPGWTLTTFPTELTHGGGTAAPVDGRITISGTSLNGSTDRFVRFESTGEALTLVNTSVQSLAGRVIDATGRTLLVDSSTIEGMGATTLGDAQAAAVVIGSGRVALLDTVIDAGGTSLDRYGSLAAASPEGLVIADSILREGGVGFYLNGGAATIRNTQISTAAFGFDGFREMIGLDLVGGVDVTLQSVTVTTAAGGSDTQVATGIDLAAGSSPASLNISGTSSITVGDALNGGTVEGISVSGTQAELFTDGLTVTAGDASQSSNGIQLATIATAELTGGSVTAGAGGNASTGIRTRTAALLTNVDVTAGNASSFASTALLIRDGTPGTTVVNGGTLLAGMGAQSYAIDVYEPVAVTGAILTGNTGSTESCGIRIGRVGLSSAEVIDSTVTGGSAFQSWGVYGADSGNLDVSGGYFYGSAVAGGSAGGANANNITTDDAHFDAGTGANTYGVRAGGLSATDTVFEGGAGTTASNGAFVDDSADVVHCVFLGGSSSNTTAGLRADGTGVSAVAINSYFFAGPGSSRYGAYVFGSDHVFRYCNFRASLAGSPTEWALLRENGNLRILASQINAISADHTGNVSVNPSYVDEAGDDFHLQALSDMIDAGGAPGSYTATTGWATDIDGHSRPQGSGHDIGVDEVVP